jgi:hypothetical protein
MNRLNIPSGAAGGYGSGLRKNQIGDAVSSINEEEIFHNQDTIKMIERMQKESNSFETDTLGGHETEQMNTEMQEHILIGRSYIGTLS